MAIKKVGGYGSSSVQSSRGVGRKSATRKGSSTSDASGASDRVQLSRGYQEMAEIKKVLMTGDDVRTERVEEIQNQVENNTYEVQPDKVAEKMLDEMM